MGIQKKILLVQLYSNGDCLYATTVAKQIKNDFPDCHLTWAIASFCKSIILNNPYVDDIMEVPNVSKNNVSAFRKFRRKVFKMKKEGTFDEVFITHNIDRNHAYYDGCIRSSILRSYPFPVTVDVTPVLRLTDVEKDKARVFAEEHRLMDFKNVILFEYAPLSGQLNMTKETAIGIAEDIVALSATAIILSSANKISHHNNAIIDGSILTLRETAALSHYCTFLLGCSSGITWISTSEAAKKLPMVQVLNPYTTWVNPVSRDFKRFGLPFHTVIEILEVNRPKIVECVSMALKNFSLAAHQFNEPIPLQFKTTQSIVYNLLCYLEFGAIVKHVRVNRQVYGNNISFYRELFVGFLIAPFKLIKNIVNKTLAKLGVFNG